MTTIDEEPVQQYLAECGEELANMEKGLLSLELGGQEIDQALVGRLVQAVRAISAGARRFGFSQIGDLARCTGCALTRIGSQRLAPPPRQVTVLLRAVDKLRALAGDPEASDEAGISAIREALDGSSTGRQSSGNSCRGADWRPRTLLVEDDFTSRLMLHTFLSRYGDCHVAVNGLEAVQAFRTALEQGQKYDLICMDIMMPEMDGAEAVRQIRALEEGRGTLSHEGVKIIMTTAVNDVKEVMQCFHDLCDGYLVKPIDLGQLLADMKSYGLVA